ncbi:phosphatidylinositol-specific phospholipase C domain-containing protein [Anaerostipes sp.]|uniref:phosphatidylinositol-specific phospholipase C domain-containing protein n=1 Tax=Anaerostipes sp. TaxID=1872530 RepID=UPI0025C29E6E|nr:phosphatidylinositol-specific phospholipase C domain-containing protein [Anaerostipes sp.]MBS7008010.1 hypothetical protein [Anaerostipes sp.]
MGKVITAGNWMGFLDGEKKLSEINLPGTHDSGTKYVEKNKEKYCCQSLSLAEQMEIGVRYFDIRCVAGSKKESPGIKHADTWCLNPEMKTEHLHLDKLVQDAKYFLQNHPTETLVFQIKNEKWNSGDANLVFHIGKYIKDGTMWAMDRIPKIDEVRGRIVLVRRFTYSKNDYGLEKQEFGLNLSSWDSECMWKAGEHTFVWVNDKAYIQDRYKTTAEEKLKLLSKALAEMNNLNNNKKTIPALEWCINLASCTKPNPKQAAVEVNQRLKEQSQFWDGRKLGMFIVDFAEKDLISKIYLSNFENFNGEEKEIHREETILSHAKPFRGQTHRSSGNFSTRYIQDPNGKEPKSLLWEIIAGDNDEASKISFQVYEDVAGGFDKGKFGDKRITSGTRTPFIKEREIYIYCPEGAKASFNVRITGMDTAPDPKFK